MASDRKYILARATGLPALCGWMNRMRPLILTYHGIYDEAKHDNAMPNTFIHVDDFSAQLNFFSKHYHCLDPAEFLDVVRSGSPFPENSLLITFDDGYESVDRLARPVLERLGLQAIVFIATEYLYSREPFWYDLVWLFFSWASPSIRRNLIERFSTLQTGNGEELTCAVALATMKRMPPEGRHPLIEIMTSLLSDAPVEIQKLATHFQTMTTEQLATCIRAGNWVGGHTHSHTILSALADAAAEEEISRNRKLLMELTDGAVAYFAYPNGGQDDFRKTHQEMLRRAGYEIAFSLTQHRANVRNNLFDVSRFHVAQEDTVHSLSFRCTGAGYWVDRIKQVGL